MSTLANEMLLDFSQNALAQIAKGAQFRSDLMKGKCLGPRDVDTATALRDMAKAINKVVELQKSIPAPEKV